MAYDRYSYVWPPRPEVKIPVSMTNFYDKRGWMAQAKLNGTCTVIFTNGTDCIFKTRHNDDHKAWSPLPEHVAFFNGAAKDGKWNVFVAELMHNKSPLLKNMLYVFDMLVSDGIPLTGTTFEGRQLILEQLIPGKQTDLWYEHNAHVVRARNHVGASSELYKRITETSYVEGLVMKNPTAKLELCNRQDNNTGWQVKCRKVTKNYGF